MPQIWTLVNDIQTVCVDLGIGSTITIFYFTKIISIRVGIQTGKILALKFLLASMYLRHTVDKLTTSIVKHKSPSFDLCA